MIEDLELVLDAKAVLGEGPCWDFRNNILYWVDIEGKKVHMYNHISGEHKQVQLEREVSAVIPCITKDTEFIVTLDNGFHLLNIETEQLKFIGDPERDLKQNRFNDGKCDAYGRLWAGTMCRDGKRKEKGSLYIPVENHQFARKGSERKRKGQGNCEAARKQ